MLNETRKKMTLAERIDAINGPLQTKGLNKRPEFVPSRVVTNAMAAKVERLMKGVVLVG